MIAKQEELFGLLRFKKHPEGDEIFFNMIISEILKIENANTGCINLFKEGIFWRIHQQSAYLFIKHVKNLKALKKFYKNVNREVVYAGFPDAILPQIQALS